MLVKANKSFDIIFKLLLVLSEVSNRSKPNIGIVQIAVFLHALFTDYLFKDGHKLWHRDQANLNGRVNCLFQVQPVFEFNSFVRQRIVTLSLSDFAITCAIIGGIGVYFVDRASQNDVHCK